MSVNPTAASGWRRGAAYERGRPSYPDAASRILSVLQLGAGKRADSQQAPAR
jgi:hypothetical protein